MTIAIHILYFIKANWFAKTKQYAFCSYFGKLLKIDHTRNGIEQPHYGLQINHHAITATITIIAEDAMNQLLALISVRGPVRCRLNLSQNPLLADVSYVLNCKPHPYAKFQLPIGQVVFEILRLISE